MEFNHRVPRKLLSSWIPKKRPVGRPQAAYGHSLIYDLKNAGVSCTSWPYLAADEITWEDIIGRDDVHIRPPNPLYELSMLQVDNSPTPVKNLGNNSKSYKEVLLSSLQSPSVPTPAKDLGNNIKSYMEVLLSSFRSSPVTPSRTLQAVVTTESPPAPPDTPETQTTPPPVSEEPEQPIPSPRIVTSSTSISSHHLHVELRRSARIAAQTLARGGRRFYSNKPQTVG